MTVKGVLGKLGVKLHFALSRIEEIIGFHLISLSNSAFDVQPVHYHFSLIHFNMIFSVADLYWAMGEKKSPEKSEFRSMKQNVLHKINTPLTDVLGKKALIFSETDLIRLIAAYENEGSKIYYLCSYVNT